MAKVGRPKLYDWTLPVAFTAEQREYVQRRAEAEGVTYADIVRALFQAGHEAIESVGAAR